MKAEGDPAGKAAASGVYMMRVAPPIEEAPVARAGPRSPDVFYRGEEAGAATNPTDNLKLSFRKESSIFLAAPRFILEDNLFNFGPHERYAQDSQRRFQIGSHLRFRTRLAETAWQADGYIPGRKRRLRKFLPQS